MLTKFKILLVVCPLLLVNIQCFGISLSKRKRHQANIFLFMTNNDENKIDALPSYSDDFLLNFHNKDQEQKQSVSNSLAIWNEELQREQERIIEWQDSFQRNGLADFTPPMASGLNCLMVGGEGLGGDSIKLPWEETADANITPLRITTEMNGNNDASKIPQQKSVTVQTAPIVISDTDSSPNDTVSSSAIRVVDPNKAAAVYDCIVDQGLMEAVLGLSGSSETKPAVQELLYEAATSIREHGIYVLVTTSLSQDIRDILEECSQMAGFEWQFELDGISNDGQVVSVGRRFCTGEMPKVGRLSRFQP